MSNNYYLQELFEETQKEVQQWSANNAENTRRRNLALEIFNDLKQPNKEDYYHIAAILQYSDNYEDLKLAKSYAETANSMNIDTNNKYLWLYAVTYDKLQLELGYPQKYGTQRYYQNDELILKNDTPNRSTINHARNELGIHSLEDEEKNIINPFRKTRGLPSLTPDNSASRKKDDKEPQNLAVKKPLVTCGNCGGNHLDVICIKPKRK